MMKLCQIYNAGKKRKTLLSILEQLTAIQKV